MELLYKSLYETTDFKYNFHCDHLGSMGYQLFWFI